jgi:hypothetical protein
LLCKIIFFSKSKKVKTISNVAEFSKEDYGSERAVLPVMMMMMCGHCLGTFRATNPPSPSLTLYFCISCFKELMHSHEGYVYAGTQNGRIHCNVNERVLVYLGVLCTESIAKAGVHVHESNS